VTTKQLKNRGFTLVELLIVIVIIAILTVISLIAYNGIQNRARTTTAESTAKSVADKAQIYYTDKGKYPASLSDLTGANVNDPWHIDSNAITVDTGGATISTRPSKENTVAYKQCNDNGARIFYFNFTENAGKDRRVGDQTGC
jgi:fimbrial protein pilin